jgi:hypothetical protein
LLVKYVPLIKVFLKGVKYLKMLKKREREFSMWSCLPP